MKALALTVWDKKIFKNFLLYLYVKSENPHHRTNFHSRAIIRSILVEPLVLLYKRVNIFCANLILTLWQNPRWYVKRRSNFSRHWVEKYTGWADRLVHNKIGRGSATIIPSINSEVIQTSNIGRNVLKPCYSIETSEVYADMGTKIQKRSWGLRSVVAVLKKLHWSQWRTSLYLRQIVCSSYCCITVWKQAKKKLLTIELWVWHCA